MFDKKTIEELAEKLSNALPAGLGAMQKDLQKSFRAVLTETFKQLDLVTREEFDVQAEVLLRTREKLEALEKVVSALEKDISLPHTKEKAKKQPPEDKK